MTGKHFAAGDAIQGDSGYLQHVRSELETVIGTHLDDGGRAILVESSFPLEYATFDPRKSIREAKAWIRRRTVDISNKGLVYSYGAMTLEFRRSAIELSVGVMFVARESEFGSIGRNASAMFATDRLCQPSIDRVEQFRSRFDIWQEICELTSRKPIVIQSKLDRDGLLKKRLAKNYIQGASESAIWSWVGLSWMDGFLMCHPYRNGVEIIED